MAGPLFFAATRAFSEYFSPEDDPEHVTCTFSGGGTLFDYTMMDAMVRSLHRHTSHGLIKARGTLPALPGVTSPKNPITYAYVASPHS